MTDLWWVRRDARLSDNPALLEAQSAGPAAAVFAWTPAIHFWSGRRRAHLARTLWSLREQSGHSSSSRGLGVRAGLAPNVVVKAAQEVDARVVWASEEYSPAGRREQQEVALALAADGRELRFAGSPYVHAPGSVSKSDGTEYQVFTPFSRAWRERGVPRPYPAADPHGFVRIASDVDLDHQAAHADGEDHLAHRAPFGEADAHDALARFLSHVATRYSDDRDRPDLAGATSGLSVALAYGQLHPRTVIQAASTLPGDGARTFATQLIWREFHADVLYRHPEAQRESLRRVVPEDAWATGPAADAHFIAWREGLTGFPLVDAGMRELRATGTMHNRVRMVAASFLIKDLHIPWQRGADYFRRTLLDYDHAQNQLNWQWVAGTGRDAAPYFRVFNPTLQAAKFDPDRRYVERWVAEVDTPAYPAPIVDHARERERALADSRRAGGA